MSEKLAQHLKKLNESKRKTSGWQCRYCGNTFLTKALMYDHMHIDHPEKCKCSKMPQKQWQCEYCNSSFKTRKKLFEHYKVCEIKSSLPKDNKGRVLSHLKCVKQCFCKFCNREFTSTHGLSYHERLCKLNPDKRKPYWQGKKHKSSSRIKTSIATREWLDGKQITNCRYNPIACYYIDKLNSIKGWHLQHALNGGEVRCGPYSLDGYDQQKNIIFEYDEPFHENSKQKERDKIRQDFLIKTLKPNEFWRYSVKFNRLYRVI